MPKVSVVMSVYNGELYLKESIESILNQTFTNFEFIIINDGSTDDTPQILDEYRSKDNRIKIINQENIGLTKSLNKGIRLSKGEYIARQDADDLSKPERFTKQVKVLDQNPHLSAVFAINNFIDEHGNYLCTKQLPSNQRVKCLLKYANPLIHGTAMLRKADFQKIGWYDEKYRVGQDRVLWKKMVSSGLYFDIIREVLYNYRLVSGSITWSKKVDWKDSEHRKYLYWLSTVFLANGKRHEARRIIKNLHDFRLIGRYILTFVPEPLLSIVKVEIGWRLQYYN